MYTCPTCRKPLFEGQPENEANSNTGEISSDEQLARQISAGLDRAHSARHTIPAGLYPNQTPNTAEGVPWRFESSLMLHCYLFLFCFLLYLFVKMIALTVKSSFPILLDAFI